MLHLPRLQRKIRQSYSDFNRALEINPRYDAAYVNRGLAYADKGDLDKAISDFNRALEINPHNTKALKLLGDIYYEKGLFGDAINYYKAVVEMRDDPLVWRKLGLAFIHDGQMENAIKALKRACELGDKKACTELKKIT